MPIKYPEYVKWDNFFVKKTFYFYGDREDCDAMIVRGVKDKGLDMDRYMYMGKKTIKIFGDSLET